MNLRTIFCTGLLALLSLTQSCTPTSPAWPEWRWGKTTTPTYAEGIKFLEQLDLASPWMTMDTFGTTDSGYPLHVAVLSADQDFRPTSLRQKNKNIVLILNAIHPGEPDGVDASLMLADSLLRPGPEGRPALLTHLPNTVIVIIPFYNIDGVLNRNSTSRVNQQGPEAYGFRGNARHLDLNRDFIKLDSRNARSLVQIFQTWDPDVLIDTHVTNGADYQAVMTLLETQPDKLGPQLGPFLREQMMPALYAGMEQDGHPMSPYVNAWGSVPDSGFVQFLESPRYSIGYAALFHTIGFTTEAHMLKPFAQRVAATRAIIGRIIGFVEQKGAEIRRLRAAARQAAATAGQWPIQWQVRSDTVTMLSFRGFEAGFKTSEVSGLPRLWYDRSRPYTKPIRYYDRYTPALQVSRPKAYLLPQAWAEVAERLRLNGVTLEALPADTTMELSVYYLEDFQTAAQPFEGHYLHSRTRVRSTRQRLRMAKGDWLIRTDGPQARFLLETLEPQAPDSYFNWNFFDAVLQQKEHFSPYVFEDVAAELLRTQPELRQALEARKAEDPAFARDGYAQLEFVYLRSPHYEAAHRRYPVFRVE